MNDHDGLELVITIARNAHPVGCRELGRPTPDGAPDRLQRILVRYVPGRQRAALYPLHRRRTCPSILLNTASTSRRLGTFPVAAFYAMGSVGCGVWWPVVVSYVRLESRT